MKNIPPTDLVPMDIFIQREPILTDLVYAKANHARNIFKTQIYCDGARLWAHKDIAIVTLLAARLLNDSHGYKLEIKDCLRTTDAQGAMQETDIVKANPQWCAPGPNRLLSPPGGGGHPRGMAIDVCVIDDNGDEIDMGTPFDFLGEKSARNYQGFSDKVLKNRKTLEMAFLKAGNASGFPILPIPPEWWDFRFYPDYTSHFAPLSDANLPAQMQMTHRIESNIPDFDENHFQKLAESLSALVDTHHGNL